MTVFRIQQVGEVETTQFLAIDAASKGEAAGLVIQASSQNSGRGRQGRLWQSPVGNLYSSILLRPQLPLENFGWYSFAVALAVQQSIAALLPQAEVKLKWPNDILVSGAKISGILLESGTDNQQANWLVAGIGVNIKHHPALPDYPTTSLSDHAVPIEPDEFLPNLLHNLNCWLEVLENQGFSLIREAWLRYAKTGMLIVKLPRETFLGTFQTLTDHGELLLRLADGTERRIASGDIMLGRPEGLNHAVGD